LYHISTLSVLSHSSLNTNKQTHADFVNVYSTTQHHKIYAIHVIIKYAIVFHFFYYESISQEDKINTFKTFNKYM